MFLNQSRTPGRITAVTLGALITAVLVLTWADQCQAIPTFARKYRTSCITCHTVFPELTDVGEAFRRNGYQFPQDDDFLVKDEPVPFGGDTYKDMFPNSVWPSDMPTLPPVFIRGQLREQFHTDPIDGARWQQDMPHEIVLGGAGTFGPDISAWWEIEWEPTENAEEPPVIERAFMQFSNLFAWSAEDDEDGMREAPFCRIALPRHAMNLRIGRFEPQVLPHYWSVHNRPGIESYLHKARKTGNGDNPFRFEAAQNAAVELHGIINQYNSYAIGFANGGLVATEEIGEEMLDDNNEKDVYFRVARKWFGYPLDGVIGGEESADEEVEARGQSPEDEDEVYSPGLDWWRALGFETGLFGWQGWAKIAPPWGGVNESFQRLGADARLQWFDLQLKGLFIYGHDEFGGDRALMGEDFYLWGTEAEYMVKPWIMAYCRYEELLFSEPVRKANEERRVVPGVVLAIRQNLKLQGEAAIDATGRDTGGGTRTDALRFQLDWAY